MENDQNILSIKNIIYEEVSDNFAIYDKPRRSINGISGEFESGKISLIKGEPNCGKTNLFRILTGKIPEDVLTYGEVLYNGKERTWLEWSRIYTYIDLKDLPSKYKTRRGAVFDEVDKKFLNLSKNDRKNIAEDHLKQNKLTDNILFDIKLCLISSPRVLIIDHFGDFCMPNLESKIHTVLSKYATENNSIVIVAGNSFDNDFFYRSDFVIYMTKSGLLYKGLTDNFDKYFLSREIINPNRKTMQKYLDEVLSMEEKTTYHRNLLNIIIQDNASLDSSISDAEPVISNNITSFEVTTFSFKATWLYFKKNFIVLLDPDSVPIIVIYILFISACLVYATKNSCRDLSDKLKKLIFHGLNKSELMNREGLDPFYIAYILYRETFLRYICVFILLSPPLLQIDPLPDPDYHYKSYILVQMLTYNLFSYIFNLLAILLSWYLYFKNIFNNDILMKMILIGNIYILTLGIVCLLINLLFYSWIKFLLFVLFYKVLFYDWIRSMIWILSNEYFGYVYWILVLCPTYTLNSMFEAESFKRMISNVNSSKRLSMYSQVYLEINEKNLRYVFKYLNKNNSSLSVMRILKDERIYGSDVYSLLRLPRSTYKILTFFVSLLLFYNILYFVLQSRRLRLNIRLKLN
ncbi:hypothetical protein P3W45_001658 [Vairimorpha bombi]|jgi:ABC-type multidrug transport system ATPase subunit